MKVLIPVVNSVDAKYTIASEFYETETYCLYDRVTDKYEWFSIDEITNNIGNLGFSLKRKGILSVIMIEMPQIAIELFCEMGIVVYHAKGADLATNIQLFNNNKLNHLIVVDSDMPIIKLPSCTSNCGTCKSLC